MKKEEFEINPLSRIPGGSFITIEFSDGSLSRGVNIKNPKKYVETVIVESLLKGLEVTKAQKEQLSKAFLAKIECQKVNKTTIARIHRDIEYWAKVQKENYYKNWYMVEKNKLNDSLKLGLLTESQYKEKISMLEKTWKSKMDYLNNQVKEKLKSSTQKLEATGKIKDCEKIYLESVMSILGKEKYKKWIECYKYHYKKKK